MADQTNPMPPHHPGIPAHQPQPGSAPPAPPAGLPPYQTAQPGPPRKKTHAGAWIAGGVATVILLCCGIGVIGSIANNVDDKTKPAANATSPVTAPSPTTAAPTTAVPTTTAPSPTKISPKPKPKPVTYKTLTERQWKLIAKNPDEHVGETIVVYGVVTQFDAATGDDTFRADVGHKNMAYNFDYQTNTILTGSVSGLKNLVEDDEFRAQVRVVGSYSYDTQIGGSTTVPLLSVDSIKVL